MRQNNRNKVQFIVFVKKEVVDRIIYKYHMLIKKLLEMRQEIRGQILVYREDFGGESGRIKEDQREI